LIQEYFCKKCGLRSHVFYENNEDVFSVILKIKDNHKKLSPNCDLSTGELTVINSLKIKPNEYVVPLMIKG